MQMKEKKTKRERERREQMNRLIYFVDELSGHVASTGTGDSSKQTT